MPANLDPIFSKAPDIQFSQGYMTAVNTTADLTSGTSYLVFTADATNGGFVQRIRFRATVGTTSPTVARVWLNNGATTGTATNNILFDEISLPGTTTSANTATLGYDLPLGFALPPSWKIYITLGTASANGWAATVLGGKY